MDVATAISYMFNLVEKCHSIGTRTSAYEAYLFCRKYNLEILSNTMAHWDCAVDSRDKEIDKNFDFKPSVSISI